MAHVVFLPSWYPTQAVPNRGRYFVDQARCLQEHGHTVGVVYPEHESLRHATPERLWQNRFQITSGREGGVYTVRRHGWNFAWRLPGSIAWRVRSAVNLMQHYVKERGRPDIIHAHSAWWAGSAAVQIGKRFNRRVVITEHHEQFLSPDSLSRRRRAHATRAFREADAVSCVSPALQESLIASGLTDAASVIPNPIFPGSYPLRPRSSHTDPGATFRFFTLSHLYANKRIGELVHAFARAFPKAGDSPAAMSRQDTGRPTDGGVELVIGGEGPARTHIEQTIDRLDVGRRVRLVGALSQLSVIKHMHAAHAFVLPSRRETFGVVLLEALACGLPILATDSGGPSSIITEANGYLVPPGSVADLAAGLRTLHQTAHRFDPAALRRDVVSRFGPDVFAQRTETLYERCMPNTPADPA
ncbi:hypothetical protein CRI94_05600 [Longibacter salinarum]|uniref:Glycosyl transferase family 1 n=1 Tax=Longibacter salinarum TaxID=1850348 RepID=A0A2A8D0J6_9BACT|nr:glycosyltransferase [Longibacter salinarum]PEN14499.1 hypothetical protein CRI94_05600 [Longibacter salinarum]